MKRSGMFFVAAAAVVGFGGGIASAGGVYDVAITSGEPLVGEEITFETEGYCADTELTFTIGFDSENTPLGTATTDGTGHASITFTPTEEGVHVLGVESALPCTNDDALTFVVASLPAAGSNTATGLLIGLAAVGGGLVLIGASHRRRSLVG